MLRQYCLRFEEIEKRRHRAYWETIKRVHSQLDQKVVEQRKLEELQKKIADEQHFEADRERKSYERQKALIASKSSL